MLRIKLLKSVVIVMFFVIFVIIFPDNINAQSVSPINCQAKNDTAVLSPKVLQINIDPDINVNGVTQNIRAYMRTIDHRAWNTSATGAATDIGWANPVDNGNDMVSLMGELSSNKVNYSIAQTIKLSSFASVPLVSYSGAKSNMTQDQFFTCHQYDNDPETITATATVANPTDSRKYAEATSAVQRSYTGGETLSTSCFVTDYQGTDWVLNKVTVGGVVKKEYVKKSDLTNFSATPISCLTCSNEIDIAQLDQTYDICGKANRGEIDEVWIWDPMFGIHSPYLGGVESTVLEPKSMGGLRLSHGYVVSDLCNTAVPVNISNYERTVYSNVRSGNAGAIHIIGHRMESSLANYLSQRAAVNLTTGKYGVDFSVYNRSIPNFGNLPPSYPGMRFSIESNYWQPGVFNVNTAGCGTIHADPLSPTDYVHDAAGNVNSSCYNSQTGVGYNMTGILPASTIGNSSSSYSCSLWGCNADGWAKYWFQHIPQNLGADKEMSNDWWKYYIDPETAFTKFPNADACSCPAGYNYNNASGKCEILSCTNPQNTCAIQNNPSNPICEPNSGQCVECTSNTNCPSSKPLCIASNTCVACRGVVSGNLCLSCSAVDPSKPNYVESTNSCQACNAGTTWNGVSCLAPQCTLSSTTYDTGSSYVNRPETITQGGVTTDNLGNIYVTDIDSNTVSRYSTTGVPTNIGNTQARPTSILVDLQGNVYTGNQGSSSVTKILPNGTVTNIALNSNTGLDYLGLVVDSLNNLFVISSTQVFKITPSNNVSLFATLPASGYATEAGIDSSNNIYIANPTTNVITKITSGGVMSTFATTGTSGPKSIKVDSNGNLYVINNSPTTISKITSSGVISTLMSSPSSFRSMTIDSEDNVYVLNVASGVSRITSAGVITNIIPSYFPSAGMIVMDISGNIFETAYPPSAGPNVNLIQKYSRNVTNNCQVCPSTLPFYDSVSKSCQVCPAGQSYDPVHYVCNVPSCTNGRLACPTNAPVCSASSTCVECETSAQCGGAKPACQNNVCVNCDVFDPSSGTCTPNGQAPTPTALKWNGSSYVTPTCANGGITCTTGTNLKCDTNTNTCKECLTDAQCSSAKPVCNTSTLSCEACPAATPNFAAVYLFDDEYDNYLTNTKIRSPTNINISSIAGITDSTKSTNEPIVHVVYQCQACPTDTVWNGTKCQVQNCNTGAINCSTSGKVCDPNSGTCLQCISDANCSADTPNCNAGTCRKCPSTKPYFDTTINACAVCPVGLHWYNDSCIADTALNLHGTVARDVDNNQQYSNADNPIPNVTVKLIGYDSAGANVLITNQTDLNGKFKFDDVAPGNYSLVETQPTDYDNSKIINNNIGVLGITDTVSNISLLTQPAGEVQFLETGWGLSGYIYNDANSNGFKDPTESGLANEIVKLSGGPGIVSVDLQSTTDANGYYSFTNLLNGTYNLTEIQPIGYNSAEENKSNTKQVTISSNSISNSNFGEVTLNIQSGVFLDNDNSNTKTFGDIAMQNVELHLTGIDSRGQSVDKIQKTGFDGMVIFAGLLSGEYSISETQPTTATDGVEIDGTLASTVTNDKFSKIKLVDDATGYYFLENGFEVSGKVFIDIDKNLNQDIADFGLFGVKVELQNTTPTADPYPGVLGTFAITTFTDKDGNFKFSNIPDGDYKLIEYQPTSYDTNNSDTFNFSIKGKSNTSFVFSEKSGSISGKLFKDTNSNGAFDNADTVYNHIQVDLIDEANGNIINSIFTDEQGNIQFLGLAAGKYRLNVPSLNIYKIVDVNPGQDVLGLSIGNKPDLGKTGGSYLYFILFALYSFVSSILIMISSWENRL